MSAVAANPAPATPPTNALPKFRLSIVTFAELDPDLCAAAYAPPSEAEFRLEANGARWRDSVGLWYVARDIHAGHYVTIGQLLAKHHEIPLAQRDTRGPIQVGISRHLLNIPEAGKLVVRTSQIGYDAAYEHRVVLG